MKEIFTRRSIRKYKDREIEPEKLRKLLGAAMCAPSAGGERPWHFMVFRDKEMLQKLHNGRPYSGMLPSAGCGILVCADADLSRFPQEHWTQDCSAATQNILTEAVHLGLGCVWLGVYPTESTMQYLRELLGLSQNIMPFALIAIGYPDEEKQLRDRYDESRVHFEKW